MAWSAAVRRNAPTEATPSPSQHLQLPSLSGSEGGTTGISFAVIDANALISFESSLRLLALAFSSSSSSPRLVSVKEVLEEVRAPASSFHLASLPCSVECIDPTDEALRTVIKFARETGDLHSLSDVDLKLLALTYMLEVQTYGSAHLRTRPPPVHVAQVRQVRERDLPGWGTNVQNLEEWEQLSHEPDEAIEQDSHILGLKELSLEQEKVEEQKHAPQEVNGHVSQEANLPGFQEVNDVQTEKAHCFQDVSGGLNRHIPQEPNLHRSQEVNDGSQEENAHDFQAVNVLEHEVVNAVTILPGEPHITFMQSVPGDASLLRDAKKMEEAECNIEEEVSQDGGDWQRSISRSTRRKHERRAARAAARRLSIANADVESIESNHVPTNDMNARSLCEVENSPCPGKGQCSLGNEDKDAGEAVINSAKEHQDGSKSDGECLSISESFHSDEEQSVSVHETESEASWTLRPLSQSKVACITADFPMQNVLLQMGLRVISPNGLQIQQLHRWALKCEACRNVTSDVGRMFCPKCGNGGTLYKVSITIDPNGVVHTGTRKRFNLRGTRYSLPLPKGGRQGFSENPVLREDQLPQKMLRPKKKITVPDFSSPAEIFAMKSGGKEKLQPPIREALAIFSGKRNPNQCRPKQRG